MPEKTLGRRPTVGHAPREDSTRQVPARITRPYSQSPVSDAHFSPWRINLAAKLKCSQPALSGVTRMYSSSPVPGLTCKDWPCGRGIEYRSVGQSLSEHQRKMLLGRPGMRVCGGTDVNRTSC